MSWDVGTLYQQSSRPLSTGGGIGGSAGGGGVHLPSEGSSGGGGCSPGHSTVGSIWNRGHSGLAEAGLAGRATTAPSARTPASKARKRVVRDIGAPLEVVVMRPLLVTHHPFAMPRSTG